jgi:hypothetical protein
MTKRTKQNSNTIQPSVHLNKKIIIKKLKSRRLYSQLNLNLAVNSVLIDKISFRLAAKRYNIPRQTLVRYVKRVKAAETNNTNNSSDESPISLLEPVNNCTFVNVYTVVTSKSDVVISININKSFTQMKLQTNYVIAASEPVGKSPVMYYNEEKLLSEFLIRCQQQYTPMNRLIAGSKAAAILKLRNSKFKTVTGLPSNNWWRAFYSRWPMLKEGRSVSISRSRAELSEQSVNNFFDDLGYIIAADNIEPTVSLIQLSSHKVIPSLRFAFGSLAPHNPVSASAG